MKGDDMAKADDMKAQDVHANETQFTQEQRSRADRRQFLSRGLAATSGLVLAGKWKGFLPSSLVSAATQNQPVCPPASPALIPVGEITSRDGKLKAVLSVIGG